MNYYEREITQEMYQRALQHNSHLTAADFETVFTDAERLGYGAQAGRVMERDGKFFVGYVIYDSCD